MIAASSLAGAQPWFGEPIVTPTSYRLVDAQAGDLNGDGRADLVSGSIGTWDLHVFLAEADGHMTEAQTVPGHQWDRACTYLLMDENQDGWADLINPDAGNPGHFRIWRNDGSGALVDAGRALRGSTPFSAGDLDGDGYSDLLTRATPDSVYVYYGSPAGFPETPLALPITLPDDPPGGYSIQDLRIADLDGDGLGDIIVAGMNHAGAALFRWRLGLPGRAFDDGHRYVGPSGYWYVCFDLADLDLDGDLDLCITSVGFEWPGTTAIFRYQPSGEYVFTRAAPRLGQPTFARVDDDVYWDLAINDGADVYFYRGPDFALAQVLHIQDFAFAGPVAVPGAGLIAVSQDNPAAILTYPNVAGLDPTSVDSERPAARAVLRVIPSVASSSATLSWADVAHGRPPNRIVILDAAGRVIRSLSTGALLGARGAASWDLQDGGGRPVPSGVYWAVLSAGGEAEARTRVTVIR